LLCISVRFNGGSIYDFKFYSSRITQNPCYEISRLDLAFQTLYDRRHKKKEKAEELSAARAKSFVTALKAVLSVFFCTDPPAIFDLFLNKFGDNAP